MRTVAVIAMALVASASDLQAQEGTILLREAYTFPVSAGRDAHVYLAIDNFSTLPLAIMRTSTAEASAVSSIGLGAQVDAGEHVPSAFFIAAGRGIRMAPSGPHLLLVSVARDLRIGDQVALTLHALGDLDIPVRVTVRPPPGTVGVAWQGAPARSRDAAPPRLTPGAS
jgi:copper(I)-binding protein